MADARAIVARVRSIIGSVPHHGLDYVCEICCGAVTGYSRCYACHQLFQYGGAASELRDRVVPMSSALNPGAWYTYLQTYKAGHPERHVEIASVATLFAVDQRERIAALLGGEPTAVTIVPSKRGRTFSDQPLRLTLARSKAIAPSLQELLRFREGARVGRGEYQPSAFDGASSAVRRARVLIIEDTWVTGATAVSAAGRLLELGAQSVAIAPIARLVDVGYFGKDPPIAWPRARLTTVTRGPGERSLTEISGAAYEGATT